MVVSEEQNWGRRERLHFIFHTFKMLNHVNILLFIHKMKEQREILRHTQGYTQEEGESCYERDYLKKELFCDCNPLQKVLWD